MSPGSEAVLAYPPDMIGLRTSNLYFFSLMFLDSEVVLICLVPFVFMMVKGRSLFTVLLSYSPGPSLHYLYLSCTRSGITAFS